MGTCTGCGTTAPVIPLNADTSLCRACSVARYGRTVTAMLDHYISTPTTTARNLATTEGTTAP